MTHPIFYYMLSAFTLLMAIVNLPFVLNGNVFNGVVMLFCSSAAGFIAALGFVTQLADLLDRSFWLD